MRLLAVEAMIASISSLIRVDRRGQESFFVAPEK